MIVSVVIAALFQMRGDITQKFLSLQEMIKTNQYNSFLVATDDKYGFEKSSIDMRRLVDDFEVESDLRRKLSAIKVDLDYEELHVIDTNELGMSEEEDTKAEEVSQSGVVFEIGKTILKTDDFRLSLIRVKIQWERLLL